MARRRKIVNKSVKQSVKQSQNVKINIRNLMPPQPKGDFISPQRGMSGHNLGMGNMRVLEGPQIRYAVNPPQFLPFQERMAINPAAQQFVAGPARVGRPDLISQETNPNDIERARPSLVLVPPQPVARPERTKAQNAALRFEELNSPTGPLPLVPMVPTGMTARPAIVSMPAMMASPNIPGRIEPRINPERMALIYPERAAQASAEPYQQDESQSLVANQVGMNPSGLRYIAGIGNPVIPSTGFPRDGE